jgi:hypothetical protein
MIRGGKGTVPAYKGAGGCLRTLVNRLNLRGGLGKRKTVFPQAGVEQVAAMLAKCKEHRFPAA